MFQKDRSFDVKTAIDMAEFCQVLEWPGSNNVCERLGIINERNEYPVTPTFSGCALYSSKDFIVINFRGSMTKEDWVGNFDIVQEVAYGGKVHRGFYQTAKILLPIIEEYLNKYSGLPVFITGHSLGGALATLIAIDVENKFPGRAVTYTFGSPRVVDPWIASAYKPINYRVCNYNDIIASVPMTTEITLTWSGLHLAHYSHVGDLIQMDVNGRILRLGLLHDLRDLFLELLEEITPELLKNHLIENYISALRVNL